MIKAENNRKNTHTRHTQKAFWWIGLESGNANRIKIKKRMLLKVGKRQRTKLQYGKDQKDYENLKLYTHKR